MSAVPRGKAGYAIGVTFTTISLVTLLARLYTRYYLVKNAGKEELTIIGAWIFTAAHMILVCVEISNGLGGHSRDYTVSQQEHILLPFWTSVPMYSISLCLSKVSIVLLYMRLFPGKHFTLACWSTIAILGITTAWACFGFMFMCQPISFLWDKSIPGHCIDGRLIYFTSAGFNIITDFILFGLPLPILAKLQLPRKQKICLILLFGVGLVGCLTSILRLRSLYLLSISSDYVYDILEAALWSLAETNVGFFCACVPTLKPLLAAITPHLLSEPRGAHRQDNTATHPYISHHAGGFIHHTSRMPSHRAYAQFDIEDQASVMEPGKVKVTTLITQDVDIDDGSSPEGSTTALKMG